MEYRLAKARVAGSNPVSRFKKDIAFRQGEVMSFSVRKIMVLLMQRYHIKKINRNLSGRLNCAYLYNTINEKQELNVDEFRC